MSIVSHGQWALAKPLVAQLEQYCAATVGKLVLTVNIPEVARPEPHWRIPLEVIANDRPLGFGANHNQAFRHCSTPWFLVLNPDIRLESDVISTLLRSADHGAGLLAPRIREPGQPAPEPFRSLLSPLELVRRRLPWVPEPSQPDWVAGMFMLLRRQAFVQVRGFDERYLMYCEDFDLCARLRLAGWQLQVGDAEVLHMAQRASQASIRPLLWHLRSLAKVWTSRAFRDYASMLRQVR